MTPGSNGDRNKSNDSTRNTKSFISLDADEILELTGDGGTSQSFALPIKTTTATTTTTTTTSALHNVSSDINNIKECHTRRKEENSYNNDGNDDGDDIDVMGIEREQKEQEKTQSNSNSTNSTTTNSSSRSINHCGEITNSQEASPHHDNDIQQNLGDIESTRERRQQCKSDDDDDDAGEWISSSAMQQDTTSSFKASTVKQNSQAPGAIAVSGRRSVPRERSSAQSIGRERESIIVKIPDLENQQQQQQHEPHHHQQQQQQQVVPLYLQQHQEEDDDSDSDEAVEDEIEPVVVVAKLVPERDSLEAQFMAANKEREELKRQLKEQQRKIASAELVHDNQTVNLTSISGISISQVSDAVDGEMVVYNKQEGGNDDDDDDNNNDNGESSCNACYLGFFIVVLIFIIIIGTTFGAVLKQRNIQDSKTLSPIPQSPYIPIEKEEEEDPTKSPIDMELLSNAP